MRDPDEPPDGEVTATTLDIDNPTEIRTLADMFEAYLLEGFQETGEPPSGIPTALWLRTLLIHSGHQIVGFCSIDTKRYAVELIYITPSHRRRGIARTLLTELRDSCPQPMLVKAPLSPACHALVDSIGVGISERDEQEQRNADRADNQVHETIRRTCRHPHGNPTRGCRRCYRKAMHRVAVRVIAGYLLLRRYHEDGCQVAA